MEGGCCGRWQAQWVPAAARRSSAEKPARLLPPCPPLRSYSSLMQLFQVPGDIAGQSMGAGAAVLGVQWNHPTPGRLQAKNGSVGNRGNLDLGSVIIGDPGMVRNKTGDAYAVECSVLFFYIELFTACFLSF